MAERKTDDRGRPILLLTRGQRVDLKRLQDGWEVRVFESGVPVIISPDESQTELFTRHRLDAFQRRKFLKPGLFRPGAEYLRYVYSQRVETPETAWEQIPASDGGGRRLRLGVFLLELIPEEGGLGLSVEGFSAARPIPDTITEPDEQNRLALATTRKAFQDALKILDLAMQDLPKKDTLPNFSSYGNLAKKSSSDVPEGENS